MARFSHRNVSEADVPAARSTIWKVVSDADLLAELTPLVEDIRDRGEVWCWRMQGISALGVSMSPTFTERMVLTPEERMEFSHQPPAGAKERAGAEGTYTLADTVSGGTHLAVDITLTVELPLPRAAKRAVERVMAQTMQRTGDRFAENLYDHLGLERPKFKRAG